MRKSFYLVVLVCALLLSGCGKQEVAPEVMVPEVEAPVVTETEVTETEVTEPEIETSEPAESLEPLVELSGLKDDMYTATEDFYVLGDHVVFFVKEGATVRGDMLINAEKVLSEVEDFLCIKYDGASKYVCGMLWREQCFTADSFIGINSAHERIEIVLLPQVPIYLEYAWEGGVMLYDEDFDYDNCYLETVYHEMTHAVRMSAGVNLGRTLEEGIAVYTQEWMGKKIGPIWSSLQYYSPSKYDESICKEGEAGFKADYTDNNNDRYQYGMRLVTYLVKTYGNGVILDITKEANAQSLYLEWSEDDSTEKTNDAAVLNVLKAATSDSVLVDFSKWYDSGWQNTKDEYCEYMKQYEPDIYSYID